MSLQQKIDDIKFELSRTQVNKATMHHICMMRAKMAKYQRELLAPEKKVAGEGFDVAKFGDARVGMVGFPSVGKSTLLTAMTPTESKIAAYEFTTLTCVPGVMDLKGSQVQLLDLPGIIEGAKDGKGRGRQVISVARTSDCILLMIDGTKSLELKDKIEYELEGVGIRLNKEPPRIRIVKKLAGGVCFTPTAKQSELTQEIVRLVLKEYKILNADVYCDTDSSVQDLIDVIEDNCKYIPCIYVINKIDAMEPSEVEKLQTLPYFCCISAAQGLGLDKLKEMIWEQLNLVRVYTKAPGAFPDFKTPIVLPARKATVENVSFKIHKQLATQMKYALVWGTSVKHSPQRVGKDHRLDDEDVLQVMKVGK
ncbi:GTP-binding protein, putative [Entamoeba histolytica HM-1:IMSS-B]|uniref:GTP-binding protein, putative n=5 Tax=Entamoeba histolytica TaxID=5759 RepID=C4M5F3_ENTH1|nr:GTP-binding protein, putative [Entamoeba histolytica HM-1:IMSS]EAL46003.1 GTP-binding protein, putative [Entamoeba histolytica HM-1:IMSS]EMH75020.1 GTP-binding protein, putative [Entamoeba histolytica HM-1:IMSS-B]ENY62519.1 developmentally-regulated GTP-binding protein, putative [Entamoeba histolytica HM-1:IMSS-A]GAT96658.1 GTP-binding protein putative [Entamoeba histolytica]|eukprot:XP_651389.1 GTP-binding protein, putative [Entamoeba histolytica HM-1:IMSS]